MPAPTRLLPRRTLPLLALGGAVLLAGCAGTSEPAGTAADHGLPNRATVGLEHMHGLAVDPTDGELYAASHYGVFRLPGEGPAERIANRHQDTMGFTIADDGTFLGSGHPDRSVDPDLPLLLGLISSDDRAETWQAVSLQGEADFHALRAVGDNVYGYDATGGTLMASTDRGRTWQSRSRTPLLDLAIDPADPDVVIATTESGPAISQDQGRTFSPLKGAPQLVVLSWTGEDLYGVDAEGQVHLSRTSGATWQPRGDLGALPQALHASDDGELFAAVDDAVLESSDDGASWSIRYREPV